MEYLAHFAAFLVAVFGVAGDTWHAKKPGVIKFTPLGWVVGALALLILGVSTRIAYVADSEKRIAEEQRQAVQAIAEMEVCLAASRLKVVLDVINANATGMLTEDGGDIGYSFDQLISPGNIEKVRAMNFMSEKPSRPAVGDRRTLAEFTSQETQQFVDLTNLALSKYSTFLNKDLILDATRLASSNLTRRFLVTREQVQLLRNKGQESYPGLWQHEVEEYPKLISLLRSLLEKTGMNSEVLACKKPEFF